MGDITIKKYDRRVDNGVNMVVYNKGAGGFHKNEQVVNSTGGTICYIVASMDTV
jgi:hypothetical protein